MISPASKLMEDLSHTTPTTFRYPALYRAVAWFGVLLFGLIVLGCVVAIFGASQSAAAVALYVGGLISGIGVIGWGMDIATRSITPGPDGLHVRWLLRRSAVPWPDVLGWRYRALSVIHIRVRHGRGIFIWPLVENYLDLLHEIDEQRRAVLRAEALIK
jgi:hypothetical protein